MLLEGPVDILETLAFYGLLLVNSALANGIICYSHETIGPSLLISPRNWQQIIDNAVIPSNS